MFPEELEGAQEEVTFINCSDLNVLYSCAYLIFVIFFTRAKFLENKIYTEKRQFFALNM